MLIYLLKATLVWGLSLLLFETLLRKNSFHAANRAYLLGALILGFAIPLIEWPVQSAAQVAIPVQQTLERISSATPAATAGGEDAPLLRWTAYLLALYACGAGVALGRIFRDAAALRRLRRGSTASTLAGGFTLLETGAEHGPFSFFRTIFLSSREAYSAEELSMVIAHEKQHARLGHSWDMLGMGMLKVTLWFHPLIHLYAQRLRLVHEYEADAIATEDATIYGRFLVEQAIAAPSPTLTHAFHSPLKTRIAMLTKNNRSRGHALRYFLTMPLIAILVAAFSVPGHTDERKQVGNKLSYKGKEFLMTEKQSDTMIVQDASTGKDMELVTTHNPRPLSINGEAIYESKDIVRGAEYSGKEKSALAEYFNRISPTLGGLQDGAYVITIYDIVVGKKGEMVYDAGAHIWACPTCKMMDGKLVLPESVSKAQAKELPKDVEQRVDAIISRELARGFSFKPAEKNGVPVNAFLRGDLDPDRGHMVIVQNGKARLQPR